MEGSLDLELGSIISSLTQPTAAKSKPPVGGVIKGVMPALSSYLQKTYGSSTADSAWCVLESPEGEFPRIRIFQQLNDLIKHLAAAEDTQTAVLVVRGYPCRLTKKLDGKRYLHVNDRQSVRIDRSEFEIVDSARLANMPIQDDGWLGDSIYQLDDGNYLESDTDD